MIGELASALPAEGGYYAWVRRALGNFWGFQEAWLSLVASIFDMAIYPTLFVAYLTRLIPWFGIDHRGVMVGAGRRHGLRDSEYRGNPRGGHHLAVALFPAVGSLRLDRAARPGQNRSALDALPPRRSTSTVGLIGGLLISMWNYMGWDNASTIATEVERPQQTYPRAMLVAVVIVSLTYVLPFVAVWLTGVPSSAFETGSWADLAGLMGGAVGGPLLARGFRVALVLGGMMSAFGMFNALVMSYSRLPLAMAQDGMLPSVFGKLQPRTRAPWVAILVLRCRLGALPRPRLRAPGHARHPALRCQPLARVRHAGRAAHQGTASSPSLPRSRRTRGRNSGRRLSRPAADFLDRPRRERTHSRHERLGLRRHPDRWRRGSLRDHVPPASQRLARLVAHRSAESRLTYSVEPRHRKNWVFGP